MQVELLTYTQHPEEVVARAAHICYSDEKLAGDAAEILVEKLISLHHDSPFEHVNFTFEIHGISRACLAQLTRHRIASYSVRSQRHTRYDNFAFVIPEPVKSDSAAYGAYLDAMSSIKSSYQKLVSVVKPEDARYVLPNACETDLILTMNVRSLWNFFHQRCCNKAQAEIRELANKMLGLCYKASPLLFQNAGPRCCSTGCLEGNNRCKDASEARRINRKIKEI